MALLRVEDALARLLSDAAPLGHEMVDLMAAAGRTLALPLAAKHTQPPFDASAMDGYALRATDVASLPARLDVIGEAAAGRGFRGTLAPGQAVRIFTGAPVPDGADAIVIQENCARDGDAVIVREGLPDGGNLRPRGGDFSAGETLLRPGARLGARQITLAAAMGHAALPVTRKPVVAILASGDELVLPGATPATDQIVCSNPYGVAAMVAAAGGEPRFLGIAADTRAALDAHLDQGRRRRSPDHHRRRQRRRSRPDRTGAAGPRAQARLLEDRDAARQADALRPARRHADTWTARQPGVIADLLARVHGAFDRAADRPRRRPATVRASRRGS